MIVFVGMELLEEAARSKKRAGAHMTRQYWDVSESTF